MTFFKSMSLVALIICAILMEVFFIAGCANKPKSAKRHTNLKAAGVFALFSMAFTLIRGALSYSGPLEISTFVSVVWLVITTVTMTLFGVKGGLSKAGTKKPWFVGAAKSGAAALALCVITCTLLGAAAPTASADAGSADAETTTTTTTAATDVVSASAEEDEKDKEAFPPGRFAVNINDDDVDEWLTLHGYKIRELQEDYSRESMPSHGEERNEKVLITVRKYVDPNANGFTDAVAYPMSDDAFEWLYKNSGWHTTTDKERIELIDRYALDPYGKDIITNPILCDAWLQDFANSEYLQYYMNDNEWFAEELARHDEYYKRTEDPIGNSNYFMRETENGPLLLTREQVLLGIRIYELIRLAYNPDLDNPIQRQTSVKSYGLSRDFDANLVRTRLVDYRENYPALMLYLLGKDGKILESKGINMCDKRPMDFEIPKPKVTTPPTTTTTSPTTTTPITTTAPVTTTTPPPTTTERRTTVTTEKEPEMGIYRIYYRYEDDGGIVYDKTGRQKLDIVKEWEIGKKFEEPSPTSSEINRKGYHLKWPSDKVVRGIMKTKSDSPWEYTVYYVRDNKPTTTTTEPPVVTTAPPPTWITEPTTTTVPDGHGAKDPSAGETFGSNLPSDGQGKYEPPAQTTLHDYVYVETTVPTETSRYETDSQGRVTATEGTVINDTTPAPVTSTVTGDHFKDTETDRDGNTIIKDGTDTAVYDPEVVKPY